MHMGDDGPATWASLRVVLDPFPGLRETVILFLEEGSVVVQAGVSPAGKLRDGLSQRGFRKALA
jgi:hypothetical protein